MPTSKLLTLPGFADELKVTQACVRRWILERKIIKVGRLIRIPQSELDRIINMGTRPAKEAR